MIEIRWLGAAGLEVTLDDAVVLIDPYLSRVGKMDLFFRRLHPAAGRIKAYTRGLPKKITAVICGHTHFDHALDIPLIAKESDCTLVGSSSLKTLTEISEINPDMRVCRGGEKIELKGGVKVQMIPSRHGLVFLGRVPYPGEIDPLHESPLKASQYRLGAMFTPRVEAGGVTLVHSGSANLEEKELQGHRCDILFMCVPGWKSVPDYTAKCVNMLEPELVIPFHFDDFTEPMPRSGHVRSMPMADVEGFVKQIKKHAPGVMVRVPNPAEVMRF